MPPRSVRITGDSRACGPSLTQQYGLDKPVLYRFVLWCAHALQGDFGTVLASGLPVADAMVGPLLRELE